MPAKLYHEVAEWYPLLTFVGDYKEEVDYFRKVLIESASANSSTMLELGSGAGYNGFYLKEWYQLTLTDLSEKMLELSKRITPECEHIQGDMRELRLNRTFDIVFIHDAIM